MRVRLVRHWRVAGSVALALLCAAGSVQAQAAPLIPVEAFFSPAKMADAEMSPSGRWMAALTSMPGKRVGFMFYDLQGKEASRFVEASPKDDVIWFQWVSDDWLVFRLRSPANRSTARLGQGLVALKRDGSSSRLLIAREWEIEDPFSKRRYLEPDHYYFGPAAPGSLDVVVEHAIYDVRGEYSHTNLKLVNVTTGAARSMPGDAPRADDWTLDAQGRARAASWTKEGVTTTWWADKAGVWREISKAPTHEQPFVPQYVEGDDVLVVRTSDATGSLEVRRFDFAAGKPAKTALVTTPGFSGNARPIRELGSGRVLGLRVTTDAYTPVWNSPLMQELQAKVDAKFPGNVNVLQCTVCDKSTPVLVYTYADTDPGTFVLWHPQQDKWQLLGVARPDIDPRRMAPLEFHRTKARDGRDLPVWVTRPLHAQATGAKPAPVVVLVHGGPYLRGMVWGWDAEAQFLASRGYVVVQPEFRGSKGYGDLHYRAGWKQWGLAMQDDITDALRYAVAQGWADGSRACIMGASYGGYAALMGLVKDPDQYRCGVALAAVSDPRNLYDFHWSDESEQGRRYDLPVVLGDRVKDAAILAAGSAVDQVSRIKAPLLLAHGGRDRRVPIENAERMLDALRKSNKPVEWVVYPEEGHEFFFPENAYDYYRRVEAFLAKHLKP